MNDLFDGFVESFRLLLSGDREVWSIILLSLRISLTATVISLIIGVPIGATLALSKFRGRSMFISLVHTGMGIPPVTVGVLVSLMLWRSGPLGDLGWMYSPRAMIIAQSMIATPLVAGLTIAALQALDPRYRLQLLALGASWPRMTWWLLREARLPLLAALMVGFGAVISEVGAALMVGGNIKGETRVLTTATVLETSRGNFDTAVAFSIVLFAITWLVNVCFTTVQQRNQSL